jgi:penicillin-binding protein A
VNKRLQRLGIVLVIAYLAVFAKLHQTQLTEVDTLAAKPDNLRQTQRKANRPRGKILSADGVLLAESINVGGNRDPRLRKYPEGELFGHITGYYSTRYGLDGVEKQYDKQLTGDSLAQQFDGLTNLFTKRENVGHVSLTVRKDLQQMAKDQLGERQGAITVLDPRSGAILAMYSWPSYNPGSLTENGDEAAKEAWSILQKLPGTPMRSKNYRERYNPGSSFKPITAAVGVSTGTVKPDYPLMTDYKPPDAPNPINNFGNPPARCGGPLDNIMTVSCNTGFMLMGLDAGWPAMAAGATGFGYNQDVPIDLPGGVQSLFPDTQAEWTSAAIAGLAQASIGQQTNDATPLQIALISAATANNGVIMKPHVLDKVRNQDATVVETWKPEPWLTAMSPETAQVVRQAMAGPVNNPNGSAYGTVRMPGGFVAGGKTGTAQTDGPLHVWFTGYAGPLGGAPTVAVSVVLLRQPGADDVTGGRLAAPIANVMLNAALPVVDAPADPSSVIATTTSTVPPAGPFGQPPAAPSGATLPTTPTTRRQG